MRITRAMAEEFSEQSRQKWVVVTAHRIHETYADHYRAMGATPEALIPVVDSVTSWASRYGIKGAADVTRLCYVATSLGHRFWSDPRFSKYVSDSVKNNDIPIGQRPHAMVRSTKTWLRELWEDDALEAYVKRLIDCIQQRQKADIVVLRDILPGHWRLFTSQDNERLITWLLSTAPEIVRTSSAHGLAYVSTALVYGAGWISDPQYPKLVQAVMKTGEAAELSEALTQIYSEGQADD